MQHLSASEHDKTLPPSPPHLTPMMPQLIFHRRPPGEPKNAPTFLPPDINPPNPAAIYHEIKPNLEDTKLFSFSKVTRTRIIRYSISGGITRRSSGFFKSSKVRTPGHRCTNFTPYLWPGTIGTVYNIRCINKTLGGSSVGLGAISGLVWHALACLGSCCAKHLLASASMTVELPAKGTMAEKLVE